MGEDEGEDLDHMPAVAERTELTREELQELLDERARREFDMSLDDFVSALEEGRLDPDDPTVAGLAIVVGARAS